MILPKRLLLIAITGLMMISPAPAKPTSSNAKDCDFLQQWNKKPPKLTLAKCEANTGELVNSGQKADLRAVYTVKGSDAAKVEAFLRKQFGMNKLRFICCYWGSSPRSYRYKGYRYTISMVSEETVEQQWHRIPTFEVSILRYTTDP